MGIQEIMKEDVMSKSKPTCTLAHGGEHSLYHPSGQHGGLWAGGIER